MKKHNNYIYLVVLGLFFAFPLFINAENPTPGTIIVADDFNDGNDDGWTRVRGEWRVDNGQYIVTLGWLKVISLRDNVMCGNCIIDVNMWSIPKDPQHINHKIGIVFNYKDENNYDLFSMRSDWRNDLVARIYVVRNNQENELIGNNIYIQDANEDSLFRVQIIDKHIKAYYNDTLVVAYENENSINGRVGLMGWGSDDAFFDNFSVSEPTLCNWSCASWSLCKDNIQTRACTEANGCGSVDDKPQEEKKCDYCHMGAKAVSFAARSTVSSSAVAINERGESVVAWVQDYINEQGVGSSNNLFFRRFDSRGEPLGEEIKVFNNSKNDGLLNVAMAMDSEGNFIISWMGRSVAQDYTDIFFQRFDKNGNKIGSQALVYRRTHEWSEIPLSVLNIAIDKFGKYTIIWKEYEHEHLYGGGVKFYDAIYGQRFNNLGIKLGEKFTVIRDLSNLLGISFISSAFNSNGNLIIAWQAYDDLPSSSYGIFMQRYDSNGDKLGESVRVNTKVQDYQHSSRVIPLMDGEFYISWIGKYASTGEKAPVFIQRFDKDGTRIGSEFTFGSFPMWEYGDKYSIVTDKQGNFVFSWSDVYKNYNDQIASEIKSQIFNSQWEAIGDPIIINDKMFDYTRNLLDFQILLGAKINSFGEIIYAWEDNVPFGLNINMKSYVKVVNIKEFKKNVFTDIVLNQFPRASFSHDVAMDKNGNFAVGWLDRDGVILYIQLFDKYGNTITNKMRVNQRWMEPTSLKITVDSNDNFILLWNEGDSGKILFRKFSKDSMSFGEEKQINNEPIFSSDFNIPNFMDSAGNFVVVWINSYTGAIYGQIIDQDGNKIGEEFLLDFWPNSLEMDASGNFIIVSGANIQKYNKVGNKLSDIIQVDDGILTGPSKLAMGSDGKPIVLWRKRDGFYAQRFDSNMNKVGTKFQLLERPSDIESYVGQGMVDIAEDTAGNFIVVFDKLLAQKFDKNGNRIGDMFNANSQYYDFLLRRYDMYYPTDIPSISMSSPDHFIITWQGDNVVNNDYSNYSYNIFGRIFNQECLQSCTNGEKDLCEVGVDCGGMCGICGNGKGCGRDIDCQSNYCSPNNACAVSSCSDGWRNGNETGVDCGGSCAACPCTENWSCEVWSECANSLQTRTCTDLNHCGTISSRPLIVQGCNSCHNIKFDEQVEEGVDCGDVCGNDCIEPVIIVPGMLGSWYKDGVFVIDPILNTYDNLISNLETYAKYELDKTLFTFPYDWRNSNTSTAQLLKSKISEIKNNNNLGVSKTKVDIVAHSMGGMVARYYIESNLFQNDINNLIFISSPQLGSTKAYLVFEGGDIYDYKVNFLLNKLARGEKYKNIFDYVHNRPVPSVYEMLPTYDYLVNKGAVRPRTYPENYPRNEFIEFLNRQDRLDYLYNESQVKLYNIYGFIDNSTIDSLRVENRKPEQSPMWEHGYPLNFPSKDGLIYQAGDDSVPFRSVSAIISKDTIVLPRKHLEIVSYASGDVIKILTGAQYNITIPEFSNKYLSIEAHSPINFYILDPFQRKLGFDFLRGNEVNEIPGAFYSGKDSDIEFIFISNPMEGEYKIYGLGTASGSYEFQSDYFDDTIATTKIIADKTESNKQDGFTFNLDYQDPDVISDIFENLFLRGDSNQDNAVDISDAIYTLSYLFTDPNISLRCQDALDANDDGRIDISDAIFTLNFLFANNNLEFPKPYPSKGQDQTDDILGCAML